MMKKLLLLIPLTFFYLLSQAQTEQGNFAVGISSTFGLMGTGNDIMSIGQSSIKYKSDADGYVEPDPDKTTSINFLPKVGFFVANNLLIGLDFTYAYTKNEDGEFNYNYSNRILSVGPYLRYYIPTNSVRPFIEATSSFGNLKSKYESETDSDENKSRLTAFGGGVGMAVPIGTKASFDVTAHYTSLIYKNIEDNDDNYRTVVGTIGLKLGFVVFLGN